ncbi:hypothetical protein ABIA39_007633 [Nocardia sp. GAS34]|uniref:hypothetical protein n=1 Tax=unclassified Nocardia TaxID=2637762 RepID=UPI003D1E5C2E
MRPVNEAKLDQSRVLDPEPGRESGLNQFLDDTEISPWAGPCRSGPELLQRRPLLSCARIALATWINPTAAFPC